MNKKIIPSDKPKWYYRNYEPQPGEKVLLERIRELDMCVKDLSFNLYLKGNPIEPQPDHTPGCIKHKSTFGSVGCTCKPDQSSRLLDDEVRIRLRSSEHRLLEAQRDLSYPLGFRDGYAWATKEKNDE